MTDNMTDVNLVCVLVAQFKQPSKENGECSEVMWTNGKSCRSCPKKDCYRNGWKKAQVDFDNAQLFRRPPND